MFMCLEREILFHWVYVQVDQFYMKSCFKIASGKIEDYQIESTEIDGCE